MLKTREPIKLHSMDIAASGAEQFYERIRSNYEQINASINGTDLLHMVTQPPEIFFAEGDESILYNNYINIENKQTQKIELLNNLVNRIILSTKGQFTYQDQVYVTNTLKKMGIKNEQLFIKYIYRNINATKNIKESIENVERISNAVSEHVENVSNVSFNRYERNYIAGEISRLSLNYQNKAFTELNRFLEENESKELLINETANIVNKINSSVAENIISKIEADSRTYITNRINQLKEEEKNIFYEEFNRIYDNSLYRDYSEEKIEKIIKKTQTFVATKAKRKTPTELIQEAQAKQEKDVISPLYQQVMNRIDFVSSFNQISSRQVIDNINTSFTAGEVNLTGFSKIVNEITLKNAKDALIAKADINYVQGNVYEQHEDLTEFTEKSVNQQLIKAILYSIIDTTFNSSINRNEGNSPKWYSVTNNLYSAADNTINRFEENLVTPVDRSVYQSLTEEAIIEQLENVEIENNRRVELYQQALEAEMKAQASARPERKNTASKAKADTLDALTNPQEFLEMVRQEKEEASIQKAFENQSALDRLPQEIKERVQLIQAITTTDADGNISEEGLQVIANVRNEIFNNTASINRIEQIHKTINQELEAGIITEVEERAILQELKEVNTLLKEDRKENPDRPITEKSAKKAHAMEILNKIEQKVNNNILRASQGDITNVNLEYKSEEVIPPEMVNILENVNISEGQTVLGDTIIEAMQPAIKKAALENIKLETEKAAKQQISENAKATVNTFIRKNAPRITNQIVDEIDQINLVHKVTEQIDTEEILEKLEEQKQILKTEKVVNTTSRNIVNEVETTESTKKLIKNEIENLEIQDQIDKTVQRQIHTFETEMFDKLENRLDNERRRRGF